MSPLPPAVLTADPFFAYMVTALQKIKTFDENIIQVVPQLPKQYRHYSKGVHWLTPMGYYTLFIPKEIFNSPRGNRLSKVVTELAEFFEPLISHTIQQLKKTPLTEESKGPFRPGAYFSIIVDISTRSSLVFMVEHPISDKTTGQILAIPPFLKKVAKAKSAFRKQIRSLHKVDGKTTFLLWGSDINDWEPCNLLFKVGEERSVDFKSELNFRFAKPMMVVDESNLNKTMTVPSNWGIKGMIRGKEETFVMNRPNDIAIYQSIANKSLERSKVQHTEVVSRGKVFWSTDTGSNDKFFDYFEEIISAVTMAYTSIECMANSCIPFGYKYSISKNEIEQVYDKAAIELNLTLREKLKKVIPGALKIASPTDEAWWSVFIELEDLRNEIIHAKKSKLEERYSKFVDERIFKVADVHNTVIAYYARQLRKSKSFVMNDFPLGVGCDEVIPFLMKSKGFDKMRRS